jgi:hypothetical protein
VASTSGSSGTSGISGTDGTYFGTSGTSGISGTSGTSFYGVTSGTSGISGTSGTSFYGVTSGTGGSAGTSGTSGFLTLTGTTDNGILTLNGAQPNASVEANLRFDGSLLTVTGAVSPTTYRETYSDLGTGGGTFSIDLSTANNFRRTVNANGTVTMTNPPSGKAFGFTIALTNGGGYTLTWTSVKWPGGAQPTLTTSGTDIIVIYTYDGGSTYYGFLAGKNMI